MAKKNGNGYRCMMAGVSLARYADRRGQDIGYRESVWATKDELRVPHSELAMHTGAAGGTIQAWSCGERACMVAYEKNGTCGTVDGLANEVMTPALQRKFRR